MINRYSGLIICSYIVHAWLVVEGQISNSHHLTLLLTTNKGRIDEQDRENWMLEVLRESYIGK